MPKLSRTGIVSLAVLAATVALACGSGEPESWERWAELGVEEVEFVFIGNFTSEEQESFRREMKAAQVNFSEHFGAVASDFTVYVSDDRELLNERIARDRPAASPVWFTCGGLQSGGAILLVLENCSADLRERGGPLAHEYFHILQSRTGRFPNMAEGWPRAIQIVEGSASYATAIHADRQGRRSMEATREGYRLSWSALSAKTTLDDIDEIDYVYTLGFLAADWLAERAGPEALLEFFRLGSHKTAFQRAFGLSVNGVLGDLKKNRQEVAPPFESRIEGTVVDADDMLVEGIDVLASVRIEGDAWLAGRDKTDEDGAFEILGPGSGYTIALFLSCPGDDGVWGRWVYAGEWGAKGFMADNDGFLEPDEEGAEPFTDGERDRTGMVIELPETRESLIAKHCES